MLWTCTMTCAHRFALPQSEKSGLATKRELEVAKSEK
jgi:hypothetical protein